MENTHSAARVIAATINHPMVTSTTVDHEGNIVVSFRDGSTTAVRVFHTSPATTSLCESVDIVAGTRYA